jgi:hypothetical protein
LTIPMDVARLLIFMQLKAGAAKARAPARSPLCVDLLVTSFTSIAATRAIYCAILGKVGTSLDTIRDTLKQPPARVAKTRRRWRRGRRRARTRGNWVGT